MCGIAGFYLPPDGHPHVDNLRSMNHAMEHRGPDGRGFLHEPPVFLTHVRLSILDVSEAGNQPMEDHSGRYSIVYNGEIYNYRELRKELGGTFQTGTDTEVILAAYAAWGKECLARFNGMFAFAIWDRQEKKLVLARDRMGIKPLYYHHKGNSFAFASEIRTLLQLPWVPRKIDKSGLTNFLCYQTVYGEQTILQGINMLGPGCCIEISTAGMDLQPFWSVFECATDEAAHMDPGAVRTKIRDLMGRAVARRLVSDVPLGAFLSGGIDSTAIVALMAQATDQPVDTFSVSFQEKAFDESQYAELVSKKYNTRHHPILLKPEQLLSELPEALLAMDHPTGDGVNSYIVSKYTRAAGIKVALSGLGGDELFAGYPIFNQLPAIQNRKLLWKLPFPARRFLGKSYAGISNSREAQKASEILRLPSPAMEGIYKVFRTIYPPRMAYEMVGTTWKNSVSELLAKESKHIQHLPELSKISIAEIATYTQNLLLRDTDQFSMAHALEVRVPFFDHNVVKFVLGVPDHLKKPSYPKQLLVESLGDLIPPEVVHRPKMGFVFPWAQWMRGELKPFCEHRIQRLSQRGIVDSATLKSVWEEFQAGKKPWLWTHIWLPVVLDEWMENNGISE